MFEQNQKEQRLLRKTKARYDLRDTRSFQ